MELSGISDEMGMKEREKGFREGDEVCLLLASLEGRNFLSAIRWIIFEQSYIMLLSFENGTRDDFFERDSRIILVRDI